MNIKFLIWATHMHIEARVWLLAGRCTSDVLRCTVTLNNELAALQVHLDCATEWDTL